MSDTCSSSAISQTRLDQGKTPDIRTRFRPLYPSRGLAMCAALAWFFSLSPTHLTAGPKYRAFQKTRSFAAPVMDVRRVAATHQYHGEVSDSPPVFMDGEFTTIASTSVFKPLLNDSQKPIATIEKVSLESEHRYLLRANNLHHDLASVAALYRSLGNAR